MLKGIIIIRDDLLVIFFLLPVELIFHLLHALQVDYALSDQLVRVSLENVGLVLYDLVHLRLGEAWLILLIVPESSVTNDVNKDVFLELLSEGYCDFHALI